MTPWTPLTKSQPTLCERRDERGACEGVWGWCPRGFAWMWWRV